MRPSAILAVNSSTVMPDPILRLEGPTPLRRVLGARDRNVVDALADGRQRERQRVHQKTGVDARRQYGTPGAFGCSIDGCRISGMRQPRERELL